MFQSQASEWLQLPDDATQASMGSSCRMMLPRLAWAQLLHPWAYYEAFPPLMLGELDVCVRLRLGLAQSVDSPSMLYVPRYEKMGRSRCCSCRYSR